MPMPHRPTMRRRSPVSSRHACVPRRHACASGSSNLTSPSNPGPTTTSPSSPGPTSRPGPTPRPVVGSPRGGSRRRELFRAHRRHRGARFRRPGSRCRPDSLEITLPTRQRRCRCRPSLRRVPRRRASRQRPRRLCTSRSTDAALLARSRPTLTRRGTARPSPTSTRLRARSTAFSSDVSPPNGGATPNDQERLSWHSPAWRKRRS